MAGSAGVGSAPVTMLVVTGSDTGVTTTGRVDSGVPYGGWHATVASLPALDEKRREDGRMSVWASPPRALPATRHTTALDRVPCSETDFSVSICAGMMSQKGIDGFFHPVAYHLV